MYITGNDNSHSNEGCPKNIINIFEYICYYVCSVH